ncbi:hypothetical protein Nepgr_019064 [Nepenthes gracilis]|uniref:Poly(A) RNA polymerase mitochondrial-like central palm domain-containing protein n=1 Tax=Nepenthes gracilis TaxID=150966 RepID=A0AAD3SSJ4_NEPGR|nr:hypothetical protein Nepgr_019064 [Nepenthes gracilis]
MDNNGRRSIPKLSDKSPKQRPRSLLMDAKQLIDTFPSYISLYSRRSSLSSTAAAASPNSDRSAILKWFSSLSVHHRLSYLTIIDHSFVQLLLQMLSKLHKHGNGTFIILPDLPSRNNLPDLCYRKSFGLLARIKESDELERLIRDSVFLFSSNDGESVRDCRCDVGCVDTVTFSEEFVGDVDRFVAAMDGISDSGFLFEDWSEMGADWVELGWLKAKGYYSMEAFVANRVEVALRLSWLSCNNVKKRGVKLRERASHVGAAANAYWRKKGCIDWWEKMEVSVKRKALRMLLGKSAKSLTGEILRGADSSLGNETWFFSKGLEHCVRYNCNSSGRVERNAEFGLSLDPTSHLPNPMPLLNAIDGLLVLQEIIAMILACDHGEYDREKLFFSSLDSVDTIWDCISRKLRGMLMVVSLDSTKIELLEDQGLKPPPNKFKEKFGGTSRRKKVKNRNMKKTNHATKTEVDFAPGMTLNDIESGLNHRENKDVSVSNKMDATLSINDPKCSLSSTVEGVGIQGLLPKVQTTARKSRKGSNKKKKLGGKLGVTDKVQSPSLSDNDVSSSCVPSQHEGELLQVSSHSIVWDMDAPKEKSNSSDNLKQNLGAACNCEVGSTMEDSRQIIEADNFVSLAEGSVSPQLECCQSSNKIRKNDIVPLKLECTNHTVYPSGFTPEIVGRKFENIQSNVGSCDGFEVPSKAVKKSFFCPKTHNAKHETTPTHAQNRSIYNGEAAISPAYPSYEWPSLAPYRFPSANSQHLPPATDRLHLEVGHNWYNRFQRSSIQQMHQLRNCQVESACGRILPQPLSMNLEWPPMVQNVNGLTSPLTCNYDSGFISRQQCALQQGFTSQSAHIGAVTGEDERKIAELSDVTNAQEISDEYDSHWVSEEEYEVHTMSRIDYNQYFGGGIMYWNPSEYPGAGFSRPPSLSSDDSSWAWREADVNRIVDDMVAFSSSYSTNGLASPSAAPFCSPFESLGPGHQALGYVRPGNEVTGKLLHNSSTMADLEAQEENAADCDAESGDSLPYPMLRPIVTPNMSRNSSRSDFKRNHDLRSPCVPPSRREQPRIKRPPSPVVLCVPRAPRPPPPSPVDHSRKQRGFPTARSGSSSPRHWGMRGWFHDANNLDEACVRRDGAEIVWPWGNKNFPAHQLVQPLAGALLQDQLIAISQLTHDQEHPDVTLPLQPPELLNCPTWKPSLVLMHNLLHEEIDCFCKQVAAENLTRRPYINWAVKRVTRSLQVLWPRSRTNIFGSNATGLSLPTSDVDLVVCLPPVRNLEPIKEAGILEGRNGIKETCLQHAARYLANQEWVKADSVKTVENTAIPIIMLVVEVPLDFITSLDSSNAQTPTNEPTQLTGEEGVCQTDIFGSDNFIPKCSDVNNDGKDAKSVRLDISFKSPSHTGLQTTELVKQLTDQFPASVPLALVLKQFLADRSLDQSYSGGLSSYCLVLLITRFLQHEHHRGRPINQNLGSIFMDFLYFFGNVFDPRKMRISIQGSGLYINRERGYSIDPIDIDDPLFPTNNVGKNCFRIHQCIKAFADAYSILEDELTCLANSSDASIRPRCQLLPKIIPSMVCS